MKQKFTPSFNHCFLARILRNWGVGFWCCVDLLLSRGDLLSAVKMNLEKIKSKPFNGPEPKVKSKVKAKSAFKEFGDTTKRSLVEEYENLYIKAKALEKVQEDPEKEQLRCDIVDLFDNLDALSNMHFVPRKRVDGYNILTNKQVIALEEAGPTALAEADLLAPEEILEPRGEPLKGASEVTSTDKRRHRKKLMRVRAGKRKLRAALAIKTNDQKVALEKVIKLAHKPGSNIKIAR
ncbi:unnamed protein product [Hymenolepis diminuta]|uniref:Uncharacterized protein n=1 Tax=Hymenolepis diminuta TaxID=6216 RepID=A0A564YZ09_HYMDI|nr:unnamed protein product [Hymenolepis diminuta]